MPLASRRENKRMKPVAIVQHTEVGAPGAATAVLESLGIPWVLVPVMNGAPVPPSAEPYSGLVLMGGYMGVYDDLPWIGDELALIRDADARGLPVAGHCLGSQLLAHALGAEVRQNPVREIGWQPIRVGEGSLAQEWFDHAAGTEFTVFQWHGDTFDIPPGGELIASSAHCANQACVIDGRHLGMQFHLEMTPALIRRSLERNGHHLERELAAAGPAVSTRSEVVEALEARTAAMHEVLLRLYRRWSRALPA